MLNYFGEKTSDYGGSCDTGLDKPELQDMTVTAKKILRKVYRVKQGFGMRYVVDILKGSNSEKIREEHKKLSVYGIGKDRPKEEWMHYIKELLHFGYLQQTGSEFPVIKLTDKSNPVLFTSEKVYLSAPVHVTIAKEPVIYQQHAYEKGLFENLKKLRNQIAHEENVPAYLILSDSSLLDLATYLPFSKTDLPNISGFGAFKIEKYGTPFLEMIQDYCKEHRLVSQVELKRPKKTKKISVVKERASDTKRASYELYRSGKSVNEIAAERQLSIVTIEGHLSFYITNGELDIKDFVPADKQELIEVAVFQYGRLSLKLLKENLPE